MSFLRMQVQFGLSGGGKDRFERKARGAVLSLAQSKGIGSLCLTLPWRSRNDMLAWIGAGDRLAGRGTWFRFFS
jgi:hypothetical protein